MKKSLLALAALTAFAGAASAQSSVTLFGIVDAGVARLSAGGKHATGMTNSGINSSRLGVRGIEDLGGGLQAGFWLEAQLSNESGVVGGGNNVNANQGALVPGASVNSPNQSASNGLGGSPAAFFNRRSTVSLLGGFGEIRLGRDYTPTFWNTTVYDPFGTNGVAQALTPGMLATVGAGPGTLAPLPVTATGANSNNAVRANNLISYFLPSLGGVTGQFSYGFGEQLSNAANDKLNNYYGFRVGYAAGPISVHGSYGKTNGSTQAGDVKYLNFGASFDAGVVKPMLVFAQEKSGAGVKISAIEAGVVVPVGVGEIRAAYSRYDLKDSDNDFNKIGLGYVHNLSKRSAVYAQYARVSNKGLSTVAVANNGLSAGAAAPGGSSSGFEFGVRHSF